MIVTRCKRNRDSLYYCPPYIIKKRLFAVLYIFFRIVGLILTVPRIYISAAAQILWIAGERNNNHQRQSLFHHIIPRCSSRAEDINKKEILAFSLFELLILVCVLHNMYQTAHDTFFSLYTRKKQFGFEWSAGKRWVPRIPYYVDDVIGLLFLPLVIKNRRMKIVFLYNITWTNKTSAGRELGIELHEREPSQLFT